MSHKTRIMILRLAALLVFFTAALPCVLAKEDARPEQPATELYFYLPFESDNQPAWSRGSSIPLYGCDAPEYVEGLFGKAAYYDRVPRPNSRSGWMNYFIGSTYSGLDNLPLEEGTFELWFNPDAAMLTHPHDQKYYFFSVNRSNGMQLYLTNANKKLELVYGEGEIKFRWPQAERDFKLHETRHTIENEAFFGAWHHIALVYNQESRKVYLDGREVLRQDALPQSPVSSIDLNVAWGGRLGPYTFFGLLDEFRIWKGCRYTKDFIPEKTALQSSLAEAALAGAACEGKPRRPQPLVENIRAEGDFVEFSLRAGAGLHRATFSLSDGMPYLLYCEPGRQLGRARLDRQPEVEKLLLSQVEVIGNEAIQGYVEKYHLRWKLDIADKAGRLEFKLQVDNDESMHMLLLQPEISLAPADEQQWQGFFDGCGEQGAALQPEDKRGCSGMGMIFPLNAAWNNEQGIAVAFAPESFFSWIFQGNEKNRLISAWRTVVNPQSSANWTVEILSFDPRRGSDDAIAVYHKAHPQFFAPDPNCDWRIYSGSANCTEAFYAKKYWKESKLEYFSGQETNRRLGNYWQWYYRSGHSTGDWAITSFFNDNSPKFNGLYGALPPIETHHQSRAKAFENLESLGISKNFYFLPWMERRYVKYFSESQINVFDVDNSHHYYDGWWRGSMRDYVVMPWGTRAGDFFRHSIEKIMRQYPAIDGFAFDVLEGNHRFRGHSSLNAERGFDQSGVFVDFLLGYAKIAEFIKEQERGKGMKYSLTGNPHIWRSSFPALFRMDNIIFEGRYFEYINATSQLRHVSRFMGSKPSSLYQSGRTDYVGNYYPNSADFSEEQAAAVIAVYHTQTFLRCMLNNLRPTPHLVNGLLELQEGMLDFKQLMRHEYAFVSALQTRMPLQSASYGHAESGIHVVVNPDLKTESSPLTFDCGYLECVPLLGMATEKDSSLWQGTSSKLHGALSLAPLSWQLIQQPAALEFVETGALAYRSKLSDDGIVKTLVCNFERVPAGPVKLKMHLLPSEQMRHCRLNGRDIKPGEALELRQGDSLSLEIGDRRWLSPSADVLEFPFLHPESAVCYETKSEAFAKRLVEYFRFWTANTPGQDKRVLPLLEQGSDEARPDRPIIVVSNSAPRPELPEEGIWREGATLHVWAPQDSLLRTCDSLLDQLDRKYHSPGRLGYQNTDEEFEFAKVATQKTLQKNVAGKQYRVEKVLPAFFTLPYPNP